MFKISLAGKMVHINAPMKDKINIPISWLVGNEKTIGKLVNRTLCKLIVHERIDPIMSPTIELLNISIKASAIYINFK